MEQTLDLNIPNSFLSLEEAISLPDMQALIKKIQRDSIRNKEQKLKSFLAYYQTMCLQGEMISRGYLLDNTALLELIMLCEEAVEKAFEPIMQSFNKKDKRKLASLF